MVLSGPVAIRSHWRASCAMADESSPSIAIPLPLRLLKFRSPDCRLPFSATAIIALIALWSMPASKRSTAWSWISGYRATSWPIVIADSASPAMVFLTSVSIRLGGKVRLSFWLAPPRKTSQTRSTSLAKNASAVGSPSKLSNGVSNATACVRCPIWSISVVVVSQGQRITTFILRLERFKRYGSRSTRNWRF